LEWCDERQQNVFIEKQGDRFPMAAFRGRGNEVSIVPAGWMEQLFHQCCGGIFYGKMQNATPWRLESFYFFKNLLYNCKLESYAD
jgi:hypothetical protein